MPLHTYNYACGLGKAVDRATKSREVFFPRRITFKSDGLF